MKPLWWARMTASSTVKKNSAALNTFLRWLAEHDHVPARQVRDALAAQLPRARSTEQRETPKALSTAQYERLIREAKARIADDALAGARDLAIVLVLGDRGLRCEELAQLERRDFLPARKGAQLRALEVRHGKGDRRRRVKLSTAATRAIMRWDRERTAPSARPPPTLRCSSRWAAGASTARTPASAAAAAKPSGLLDCHGLWSGGAVMPSLILVLEPSGGVRRLDR